MLKVALEYREVVDDITANKSLKLRKYKLDDDDWDILKDLLHVLKVRIVLLTFLQSSPDTVGPCQMYKEATLFFSQDDISMIAHVIPTMDRIDAMLKDSAQEPLSPSVKHALSFARKLMDQYYSKTDLSNVYRIAMGMSSAVFCMSWLIIHLVLHPQLKLKYFLQHGWSKRWVSTAENIVREEFVKYDLP
jgi:hypothetical protein